MNIMYSVLPALVLSALLLSTAAFSHGSIPDVSVQTLAEQPFAGLVLDVRTPEEFAENHIPGAVNVPHKDITAHLAKLGDIEQPVLVYCRSGRRAAIALEQLSELGFSALYHLDGDMQAWQSNNLPMMQSEPLK